MRRQRIRRRAQDTPWDWALAARTWTAFWDDAFDRTKAPRVSGPDGDELLQLPDGRHSTTRGDYFPDVYPASPMLDRIGESARVLIGGYYGHGNLGDETILQVMLEELREAMPNVSPVVASGNPTATRRAHDVEAIGERDIPALIDAASTSSLIIAGGGGLFQDYWGAPPQAFLTRRHWGLPYFNAYPALAELHHKPFMLFAVGAGPLETEEGRRQTRLAFERADRATVRDAASLQLLREIGACTGRVEVAADPAFLIDPAPREHGAAWLRSAGLITRPSRLIAVSLRDWDIGVDRDHWMTAVVQALDGLLEDGDTGLVFVPFQIGADDLLTDDIGVAERVRAAMRHKDHAIVGRTPLDPHLVTSVFAASDVVLAMRAHAAILAAVATTPVVALAYDPKVSALMSDIGMDDLTLPLANLASADLVDRVRLACRERESRRAQIAGHVRRLRDAARRSSQVAVQLVQQRFEPRPVSAEWRAELADALVNQTRRAEAAEARVEQLAGEFGTRDRAAVETPAAPEDGEQFAVIDDLTGQLDRRTHEVAVATAELHAIQRSRAWRTILAYRTARRQPMRIARGLLRRTRALASRVKASSRRAWDMRRQALAQLHPAAQVRSGRERLRQWLHGRMMNPYVFLFDRFKRARMSAYGPHLANVRSACEPGLVSIVLPAYNGAAMISGSIDSVLAQTYLHFELIIVDDGSTDATPRIVAEYAARDPRVRVISQENQKLPRALSRGFHDARGEFLTWTSCDNRLKPDFCEKLVACLRRHPCWDMAYANLDLLGEDGEYLRGAGYWEGYQRPWGSEHIFMPEAPLELNVWANNTIGGAFMYRNRIAVLIGEYSPFRFIAEDYDYWMRINALGVLRHADFTDPVYEYRFHSGSLTSRWEEFRMLENRDRLMVFEEFRRDFYLSPLLWIVEADGMQTRTAEALNRQIKRLKHLRYDDRYPLRSLARLWTPTVHLKVGTSTDAARPPSPTAVAHALKVFVTTDDSPSLDIAAGWDLCCVIGQPANLPRLDAGRGWIAAPDAASLVHAIDIRAKSHHLALIETEAEIPPAPQLAASVVICIYRFGPRTRAALQSVLAQQCNRPYEIVVVHNTAGKPADLGLAVPTNVPVREFVCPVPGLSAARNAAIAEARGEIICFLDDDAVADPAWLQQLCSAFDANPDAGVIGGHIILNAPPARPAALRPGWERYWSHFVTGHAGFTRVQHWWEFPWGANWAARRTSLVAAGGFRTRYGRSAQNFWGGEELVTASVIQKLGYAVGVVPEARVTHDVDPDRFTYGHARRTLRAGHQVSYAAQRDLYISNETGFSRTVQDFFTSHYDESIPVEYRHWRNASHRKRAQARLLLVQLRDLANRLRKPAVTLDPC